jgi:hypothetical protein
MIWLAVFLLFIAALCATVCVVGWLALAVTEGVLSCLSKMFENLRGERPIIGLLYLVPLKLFVSAIAHWIIVRPETREQLWRFATEEHVSVSDYVESVLLQHFAKKAGDK